MPKRASFSLVKASTSRAANSVGFRTRMKLEAQESGTRRSVLKSSQPRLKVCERMLVDCAGQWFDRTVWTVAAFVDH